MDTTRKGIAPFYSDKYQKKTILAGELFYPEKLDEHIKDLLTWKNLTLTGVYGAAPYDDKRLSEWMEKAVLPLIPIGKLIQPEDIANTIVFLASEQARMITGQVIKVSGGHAL